MLKIYNAYSEQGNIIIKDYIYFTLGSFDTGINGFGQVKSNFLNDIRANYELQKLKYYRDYLKSVKCNDGYVEDFILFNPISYEMLDKMYSDYPKDFETYEMYGLNEEGILLFTDNVKLNYTNTELIQRVFGRYPETGMYLMMPNASFSMTVGNYSKGEQENYEILQSQKLGKRLVLSKMSRNI